MNKYRAKQGPNILPQKPNCEQQTFRGQVAPAVAAYSPHAAVALQLDWQPSPQYVGLWKHGVVSIAYYDRMFLELTYAQNKILWISSNFFPLEIVSRNSSRFTKQSRSGTLLANLPVATPPTNATAGSIGARRIRTTGISPWARRRIRSSSRLAKKQINLRNQHRCIINIMRLEIRFHKRVGFRHQKEEHKERCRPP